LKIFADAIFGWSFRVTIIFFNQFSGEFSRAQLGRFRGPLWMTFWMPFREPFGKHFGNILGCKSGHVFGSILGALWGCNRTLWGCNTAPRDTQSPRSPQNLAQKLPRGLQRLPGHATDFDSHATGAVFSRDGPRLRAGRLWPPMLARKLVPLRPKLAPREQVMPGQTSGIWMHLDGLGATRNSLGGA